MRALVIASVAVALAGCGGGGGGGGGTPTTTVMVFMAGDNNLEEFAIEDLNEMEAVGSSAAVNIVVQVDTQTLPVGGSTTAKRLRVEFDANPATVTSPALQDLGEINTSSAAQIVAFVVWAVQNFPADRYVLVLWDHGGGWPGYATDDTSGAPPIPVEDIGQALQDIQTQTGIARLDMLGFDACLMATLEVAHEVAPFARYLVASEELEPGQGWPYEDILGPLVADPGMSIRDFAASIPPEYQFATALSGQGDTTTLATIDLDRVPALVAAFETFAEALLAAGVDIHYEALGRARFKTDKYQSSGAFERDLVDLGDLLAKVVAGPGIPASVMAAAANVTAALNSAVIAEDHGPVHAEASGLSVNFNPFGVDPTYFALAFSLDTSWDDFLDAFADESATDVTAPTLTIDQSANLVGPSPATPATLDVTITGNDAIDLQAWIALDQGGGIVDILGAVSQDEAQPGPTQLTWDGSLVALADGTGVSALPVFPVEPGGCAIAITFVRYRASALSPDQDLLMFVDCATAQIVGFFEVVDLGGREVLGAVQLVPGSELEVLFLRYDTNAGTLDLVPGAVTLNLPAGAASLAVTSGPAGSGSYGFLAIVEDIAGNSEADGVDVTIP